MSTLQIRNKQSLITKRVRESNTAYYQNKKPPYNIYTIFFIFGDGDLNQDIHRENVKSLSNVLKVTGIHYNLGMIE